MQKYVNLADLVKSFPTKVYLQKSASIQPRTSLSKFGGKFNSFFIRLLNDVTGSSLGFAWLYDRGTSVSTGQWLLGRLSHLDEF